MTIQRTLILIVYAPALVGDDGRTLSVVHGIERAFPGVRLEWELSKAGRPIALPQRDRWLAEASARGMLPLVCNGDQSSPVTVTGWGTSARQNAGGQPQFEVHAELSLDAASIEAAADVLEGVAEGSRAFWGCATPYAAKWTSLPAHWRLRSWPAPSLFPPYLGPSRATTPKSNGGALPPPRPLSANLPPSILGGRL